MLKSSNFSKSHLSVNCPVGELTVGELGIGELSVGEQFATQMKGISFERIEFVER
jgi:hypothetical protein